MTQPAHGATTMAATRPLATLLARARRATGILGAYFSAQVLTQGLNAVAGLVLVNVLPLREFALYTLATSFLTFFSTASDLGSTGSLVYFYRHAQENAEPFGRYLAAVRALRRAAFGAGAVVVTVAFLPAARAKGFGSGESLAGLVAVLLAVGFQVVASIGLMSLRLHHRYHRSYFAEGVAAATRLLLAVAIALLGWTLGWAAIWTAPVAGLICALLAHDAQRDRAVRASWEDIRKLLRYLAPSLPSAAYFSLQGPLIIWLAASFGSTTNIAQVGALGRLGIVVSIFSGMTPILFLPRLAHTRTDREFFARYLQFGALLAALGAGLVAVAWQFPEPLLALLGRNYRGLPGELRLVLLGAAISLLSGFAVGVNLARAWNRWETLAVVVLIAAQAGFVATLPMASTAGVLRFQVLSSLVGLLLQLAITAVGLRRPQWVRSVS